MRIVSLVPSLTETLWELGVGPSLVGVTKFCVHPAEARTRATVVGGTKDPDVEKIRGLRPDLVIADEDENKPEHLQALQAFTRVHVTRIGSVRDAARELAAIGRLVDREFDAEARSMRILEREAELRSVSALGPPLRLFVPIWRKPLMTVGGRTYMSDLVSVAGGKNVFDGSSIKYFETSMPEVRVQEPEAVLLPTEPYRFRDLHRAEFAQALGVSPERVQVVDGEAFTWFGTRTLEALDVLTTAVAGLRAVVARSPS